MKLSILICSLFERRKSLDCLIKKFIEQTNQAYSYELLGGKKLEKIVYTFQTFEIIVLTDAGRMYVGQKRNMLKSWAKGEYLCYFDDDDEPSKDYIPQILKAIEEESDVITFKAIHYENGRKIFDVDFGNHGKDYDEGKVAYRLPNHLSVWKRSLARRVQFPRINFGEDGAWARKMNRHARNIKPIDKVLYHYWFNTEKTRTQQWRTK